MKNILKRVLCWTLALTMMGGYAAMGESGWFAAESGEAWYPQMLAEAQLNLGNNVRLNKLIARAQAGEEITVAAIGGSITEGAGASQYKECYAYRFFRGFADRYGAGDGKNVHFVNAGVGGTPSTFGLMRYQRDIVDRVKDSDGLPDLVIIEYAVNDYAEPSRHQCYESLVKTVLSQPNDAVVILLFCVFPGGFTLQDELKKIGTTYDVMMVSIRDSAFRRVGSVWTQEQFFFDQYHPTSLGHGVMADCLLAAVEAAHEKEENPADIDLDVKPAYGTSYVGLKTIYAHSIPEGVTLERGGFAHDDTSSYSNAPVGRVCGPNFFHNYADGVEPLRFTATFKNLLIAWRAVSDTQYGRVQIKVDGKTVQILSGGEGKWGQSEVILAYESKEAAEHTVEICIAENSKAKKFTITAIGYTP